MNSSNGEDVRQESSTPVSSNSMQAFSPVEQEQMETVSRGDTERLTVRIKMTNERTFECEIQASERIRDLKQTIQRTAEIAYSRQRLIYRGKLLKDEREIASYSIEDGHTIHLVVRPVQSENAESNGRPSEASSRERRRREQTIASGRDPLVIDNLRSATEMLRQRSQRRGLTRNPTRGTQMSGARRNLSTLREALSSLHNRSDNEEDDNNEDDEAMRSPRTGINSIRDILSLLANDSRRSSTSDRSSLGSQTTGSSSETSPADLTNMEHVLQGLLTFQTMVAAVPSVAEIEDEREYAMSDANARQFYVGQWLDVKDTVNQWLESTVMDLNDTHILVHYHGWPERWNEWIPSNSDRIAPFRTRTVHSLTSARVSPTPTIPLQEPPSIGNADIRSVIPVIRNGMRDLMPYLDTLANLCEEGNASENSDNHEESSAGSTEQLQEYSPEMLQLTSLIAPLFDRFGRVLTDSARHLHAVQNQQRASSETHSFSSSSTTDTRMGRSGSTTSNLTNSASETPFQDLINTSSRLSQENSRPRRNIDVHIHAIVTPSSLQSLARNTQNSSSEPMTPPGNPAHEMLDSDSEFGNERSDLHTPLLGENRGSEYGTQRRSSTSSDSNDLQEPRGIENNSAANVTETTDNTTEIHSSENIFPELHQATQDFWQNEIVQDRSSNEETTANSNRNGSSSPTFLDIIRRTINNVRQIGSSSNNNSDNNNSSSSNYTSE